MKRCPQCQRIYADESLNFCLSDGTALATAENLSEPTIVMGSKQASPDSRPRAASSFLPYVLIGILALIAGGAVVAIYFSRSNAPTNGSPAQTPIATANAASNSPGNEKPVSNRTDGIVEYPDAKQEPLTADSVKSLVSAWERAQDGKSFASYQACYDKSFVGIKTTKGGQSQSYSYASWMADRRKMFSRAVNLSLDISNLQIRMEGDTAIAQFDQYYRSLSYSDWGPKEIRVRMTPAGPRIVREELKASYPL